MRRLAAVLVAVTGARGLADGDRVASVVGDDLSGRVKITWSTGQTTDAPKLERQLRQQSPAVAIDHQTVGWLVTTDDCCGEHPEPRVLVVFRGGRVVRSFAHASMIWKWAFVLHGKQVAVALGPEEPVKPARYLLYEVDSGRVIDSLERYEVNDWDPAWVRLVRLTPTEPVPAP